MTPKPQKNSQNGKNFFSCVFFIMYFKCEKQMASQLKEICVLLFDLFFYLIAIYSPIQGDLN